MQWVQFLQKLVNHEKDKTQQKAKAKNCSKSKGRQKEYPQLIMSKLLNIFSTKLPYCFKLREIDCEPKYEKYKKKAEIKIFLERMIAFRKIPEF